MDSIDAIARLYHFVDQDMNSDPLKLALYDLITRQSRGHGINQFVAKALLQKYLIERNDVTKLHSTYDSGRYVLHYIDFLSVEERVTLHYRLGIHAYHLRLFQESIELCSNNITEDIPVSLCKAESVGIISDSYYYLGDYHLSKKFLKQYMTFPYPHIKENATLMAAALLVKKGDRELALFQLHECLQSCNSITLLRVINQLIMIYLESRTLSSIEELLTMEAKFIGLPYTTPHMKSALAHYFKLKGDYNVAIGNFENGIECYMESYIPKPTIF